MTAPQNILVLNAGSSSIKAAVFDHHQRDILRASATGIGSTDLGRVTLGDQGRACALPDHSAALGALMSGLSHKGISPDTLRAAAHRVVHGGADLTAPCRITAQTRSAIAANIPLAPLHNPHNLAAIDAITALAPNLIQCASFDTAFHATNPDLATHYALPRALSAGGMRRYGFHGISYAALVDSWAEVTGTALPGRLLAMHLGNGASLCAIRDGQSVATTMGYSPLEGLTMGTRAGSIDGNAVLDLADTHGIDGARRILNHDSGLLGLSGLSADMRTLEQDGSDAARFAIAHFCYWAARHAGSMAVAMGGVDAIAFTGGIGEHAGTVRSAILEHLSWLGALPVRVIPAQEERQIARDAIRLIAKGGTE
ncbi:MAG: acetate kinase [Marinibacterium sp.]|nr:acetate kinase [Marinibacterium sp.]